MANPNRLLALGVLGAFATALGSVFVVPAPPPEVPPAPPALLPTLHARPAEVTVRDSLRRGETLSQLLERSELDAAEARLLLEELSGHQDPRSLRPGMTIEYRRSTRDGALRGVEMRVDADHTLEVARRGGSWDAAVREVETRPDTAVLAGTVRSSLYQALLDGAGDIPRGEREAVADVLADKIFAWRLDFSRDLREGDTYRILLERSVRPDGTARAARVLAVQFNVNGTAHEAYFFRGTDGWEDYYDARGESLRRAFLRAPLEFRRISSTFSRGRYHPILHRMRAHNGIDYAAAQGTPVRAVGDGVIAKAGWGGGYGNVVQIRHRAAYASRYAHLRGFAPGIRPGVRVKQGDLIGYVGTTGLSTGPHLHYEFHENGRPINPTSIKFLTGEPVPASARGRFRAVVRDRVARMDREVSTARLASAKTDSASRGGD